MAVQRTFSIIKPEGTRRNFTGQIIARIEVSGLRVVASKRVWMTRGQAEGFYAVHRERPFFNDLCNFMTSGPVVPMALQGENAVQKFREVIGDTDPNQAEEGTVRQLYGESKESNPIHGSDSDENARIEIEFFFAEFFGST